MSKKLLKLFKEITKQPNLSKDAEQMFIPYKPAQSMEKQVDRLYQELINARQKFVGKKVIIINETHSLTNYTSVDPRPGHVAFIDEVSSRAIKSPYQPEGCTDKYFYHGIPYGYEFTFKLTVLQVRDRRYHITNWYKARYDDLYFIPENAVLLPYQKQKEYLTFIKEEDLDVEIKTFHKKRAVVVLFKDRAELVHFKMIFGKTEF